MTRYSPLHEDHLARGAKMADFGGWLMPIDYPATSGGGVLAEHSAVRERVGIFDVSHLGKARVSGSGAKDFVNSCFTNDLSKVSPGKAQYTLCCDPNGGVVDDLIVYYKSDDELFLIPNAANTAEVVRRLKQAAPAGIEVSDLHESFGVLAVQGPLAKDVVGALGLPTDLEYMSFVEKDWNGKPVIICRTGYTGEFGFELVPRWSETKELWDALVSEVDKRDGRVCGLAARDTLRTEMGYPLHGHELSLDITPVQARATWAVGWKKEKFWGDEVLRREKEQGPHRRLVALKAQDRGIPRADMNVEDSHGNVIGVVTSGTFSPTLKVGIALALVDSTHEEHQVVIDVRGRKSAAEVVSLPFVPSHTN